MITPAEYTAITTGSAIETTIDRELLAGAARINIRSDWDRDELEHLLANYSRLGWHVVMGHGSFVMELP